MTTGALIGMLPGGLFGFVAGTIAPDIFEHFLRWTKWEPRGSATVLGAVVGVLLGGGLGVFGIVVALIGQVLSVSKENKAGKAGKAE